MKSNLQKQQQTEVDTVHKKRAYGGEGTSPLTDLTRQEKYFSHEDSNPGTSGP